jgi:hypothetical protein
METLHKSMVVTTAIWKQGKRYLKPKKSEHYSVTIPPSLQKSELRAQNYAMEKIDKFMTHNEEGRKVWYVSATLAEAEEKSGRFTKRKKNGKIT